MKKYILIVPVLLLAMLIGQGSWAMDNTKVFGLTGKQYYRKGWRVSDGDPRSSAYAHWQIRFNHAVNDRSTTAQGAERLVLTIGNDINSPVYTEVNNRQYTYYYPIEEVIRYTNNTTVFSALLNHVPVNGYPDYSPLKDILLRLARQEGATKPEILLQFLDILINKGVSLDIQLPDHIGFGPDTSACRQCTARAFLERKGVWKNQQIRNAIGTKFDKVPVAAPAEQANEKKQSISGETTESTVLSTSPVTAPVPIPLASEPAAVSTIETQTPTLPPHTITTTTVPAPEPPGSTTPITYQPVPPAAPVTPEITPTSTPGSSVSTYACICAASLRIQRVVTNTIGKNDYLFCNTGYFCSHNSSKTNL
jgi:hypothetical protein